MLYYIIIYSTLPFIVKATGGGSGGLKSCEVILQDLIETKKMLKTA